MANNTEEAGRLLNAGVELGYLNEKQCEEAFARQAQLARGGIELHLGQTLLERRFLTPTQLKLLMAELEYRRVKRLASRPVQPKPVAEGAPRIFGQYELLEPLSDGHRSRIFKARDIAMNRVAVLKILPKSLAADPQWAERFKRELQIAGTLTHPNIVAAFGAGEIDGNPYMAIEYIEGSTLRDRLEREGNLPEKTAWLIAREIAKGLAYAATHNILHRNIKPDNVLCGADGTVKIIDLGCSKSMDDNSGLTLEGTTIGTPFYISPEQARGTRDLDVRTDLYSLGCTVYHMLTGSVPFFGEQITDVMLNHTQAPRPDPRGLLPEIGEASANLVMRLMSIDPNGRPESADALVAEIDALLPKLPEPVAIVRPVAKVRPSQTTILQDSRPAIKAVPELRHDVQPAPGIFARFSAWLKGLFS